MGDVIQFMTRNKIVQGLKEAVAYNKGDLAMGRCTRIAPMPRSAWDELPSDSNKET